MTAVESIGLTLRFVVDSSKTQQKGGVGGEAVVVDTFFY